MGARPGFLGRVVAASRLPGPLKDQVRDVLVSLGDDPTARTTLCHGFIQGFARVDDAVKVSDDGRRATLEAKDVCVLDSFQFGGAVTVPASVNFKIRWEATGRREHRGSGLDVPPTDPAAFLGRFATARSTGTFSGSEVGFSFHLGAVNRVARPNRPALTERACQRAHPRRAARHSLPCTVGP